MASTDLTGRRVLAIVTNYGVEQDELVVPTRALRDAGATVVVAAQSTAPVETLVGDKDPGEAVRPDTTIEEVDASEFDLLLVPGGTINADTLRQDAGAVSIASSFAASGRPIAAICHGPWLLVEADLVKGKQLTSFPSLTTDIRNAGGSWTDASVITDVEEGFTLVTSRTPDDLDDFVRELTTAASSERPADS
ncbi:type 1 glutamine amidotransferase domain-containing protein [Frigoribacterium sp. CFBP9039]|uniref:type 1 glutamine amidotransferase domain-containing protein n=1 Tax=unclassified Frigoribacterium TaxID=2627005 RepID=UPI002A6AB706|nr:MULTISPECIES: type 1 glutamine amidotransferase domain-containing protein [unclassified Frigoribacterium]MDY0892659.1 type 1 glutamine amidotransferase domain-containing protein [Frigoribacterium sp. CFBP9030]MDY0945944.1 type 1 glutamine amidotransferase domain-containing protein [Frigoribacterium sp. CFBP9039]